VETEILLTSFKGVVDGARALLDAPAAAGEVSP
jgi:hypothetical protein